MGRFALALFALLLLVAPATAQEIGVFFAPDRGLLFKNDVVTGQTVEAWVLALDLPETIDGFRFTIPVPSQALLPWGGEIPLAPDTHARWEEGGLVVEVTDLGCVGTDAITVLHHPSFLLLAEPASLAICVDDAVWIGCDGTETAFDRVRCIQDNGIFHGCAYLNYESPMLPINPIVTYLQARAGEVAASAQAPFELPIHTQRYRRESGFCSDPMGQSGKLCNVAFDVLWDQTVAVATGVRLGEGIDATELDWEAVEGGVHVNLATPGVNPREETIPMDAAPLVWVEMEAGNASGYSPVLVEQLSAWYCGVIFPTVPSIPGAIRTTVTTRSTSWGTLKAAYR